MIINYINFYVCSNNHTHLEAHQVIVTNVHCFHIEIIYHDMLQLFVILIYCTYQYIFSF